MRNQRNKFYYNKNTNNFIHADWVRWVELEIVPSDIIRPKT